MAKPPRADGAHAQRPPGHKTAGGGEDEDDEEHDAEAEDAPAKVPSPEIWRREIVNLSISTRIIVEGGDYPGKGEILDC